MIFSGNAYYDAVDGNCSYVCKNYFNIFKHYWAGILIQQNFFGISTPGESKINYTDFYGMLTLYISVFYNKTLIFNRCSNLQFIVSISTE